jgi:hypothetical protein
MIFRASAAVIRDESCLLDKGVPAAMINANIAIRPANWLNESFVPFFV